MAYNLSSRPIAEIDDAIDHHLADVVTASDDEPTVGVTAQLTAAKQAVAILAGVVGRAEDERVVTVNGHANPDHAAVEGRDEFISITVSVRRPAPMPGGNPAP